MSDKLPGALLSEFTFVARVVSVRSKFRNISVLFSANTDHTAHVQFDPSFYEIRRIGPEIAYHRLIPLRAWLVPTGIVLFMQSQQGGQRVSLHVSRHCAGFHLLKILIHRLKQAELHTESRFSDLLWRLNVLR